LNILSMNTAGRSILRLLQKPKNFLSYQFLC
jgi:hypothetical protein